MAKKPVALFIGRFQPFHKGHLSAIKWIAARSRKVIVAIGSAQKACEPENPFSKEERKRMISAQLKEAGLAKKCKIAFVDDIGDNEKWVGHVERSVPAYDICYTNNPLVRRLMRKAGKKVKPVPFFKKEMYNATKIRKLMEKGQRWQERVPKKAGEVLRKIRAEERVKLLCKKN